MNDLSLININPIIDIRGVSKWKWELKENEDGKLIQTKTSTE